MRLPDENNTIQDRVKMQSPADSRRSETTDEDMRKSHGLTGFKFLLSIMP